LQARRDREAVVDLDIEKVWRADGGAVLLGDLIGETTEGETM
jgi:hypothetical protein